MNIKIVALSALLALAACSPGHRKTAKIGSSVPSIQTELPALAPHSFEPLGCAVYAGDDRPDYDANALECIIKWMGEAHEYLAEGGKPTEYTSDASIKMNMARAQKLVARLSKRFEKARSDAAPAATPGAETAPAAPTVDARRESLRRYLEGVIHFQKGDFEGARREWLEAKRLDPANPDVQAGLHRLETHPRE